MFAGKIKQAIGPDGLDVRAHSTVYRKNNGPFQTDEVFL